MRAEQKQALEERGQAQARDRVHRRRPPQAQSAADRRRRARARRGGAHRARRRIGSSRSTTSEQALRKSLERARAVIAEVLAALQRIGRQPPPALMVRAGGRAAVGALRHDARRRAAARCGTRPRRWSPISPSSSACARRSPRSATRLAARPARARGRAPAPVAADRGAPEAAGRGRKGAEPSERQRAAELARQADNLKDLIAKLEQGLDAPAPAARAGARRATTKKAPAAARSRRAQGSRPACAGDRLRLRQGTAAAAGQWRANQEFGASDGLGGTEKGLSIATRPGPRSRLRATAGWSMPDPSAITANS